MKTRSFGAALCALFLSGCIFANVERPLSYRSPTPSDVPGAALGGEVDGEACSHVVLWLVAFGDSGYRAAMNDALENARGATTLADVKSDSNVFNVLGVYQRICTRVRGRTVASAAPSPASQTEVPSP